jgi:hypothetical protein
MTAVGYNRPWGDSTISCCRTVLSVPKTCQNCGTTFACGAPCHCWCDHVALDAETRAELPQRFTDCLCPACLEAAAAKRLAPAPAPVTGLP